MFPVLLEIGGKPIYGYWFFYGLGLTFSVCIVMGLAPRRNLDFWKMWWLCLLSVLAAFIFARLSHGFFEPNFADYSDLRKGGEVSFGGIVGALAVAVWWTYWKGMPLGDVLDIGGFAIFAAEGIQRIGCFCNGCCYGPVTQSFLGVSFLKLLTPDGDIGGSPCFQDHLAAGLVSCGDARSLPVIPMQLFTSGICLLVTGLGLWLFIKGKMKGRIMWVCFLVYGILRFSSQWFRPNYDLDGSTFGWNSGHTFSLIMILTGGGMLWLTGKYSLGIARCGGVTVTGNTKKSKAKGKRKGRR
jgi:phosphatidylglycerol:prolipoprotein diacylglycerol transferase